MDSNTNVHDDSFKSAWSEVDPSGSGYIQRKDVVKFLNVSLYSVAFRGEMTHWCLFQLLRGRFRMCIYDDRHSISNLQKLSQQGMSSSFIINEKPSGFSSTTNVALPIPYNIDLVNKSLSKIDSIALGRRRRDFNLCYLVRKHDTLMGKVCLFSAIGNHWSWNCTWNLIWRCAYYHVLSFCWYRRSIAVSLMIVSMIHDIHCSFV